MIVFTLTDPAAGKKRVSAFIVPTNIPGYEVISVERKLGQHSSDKHRPSEALFNRARLTGRRDVSRRYEQNGRMLTCLRSLTATFTRLLVYRHLNGAPASGCIGLARVGLELSI
ncbi:hypothetical protein RP75_26740 [Agrobacterium arsenijevicii]|uniref:Uncharacterized protein n=1 Tax=Agrobacterium arsenijevicii TaxID=1585697 RepID=A0ABR5D067_9HYPH|nr:hypothetical protein RP75_26740 [Agrobacterium arsenijevicii]